MEKTVNIYIVYETSVSHSNNNYSTLKKLLLGEARLTKNTDIDKYKYFDYGILVDRRENFSVSRRGFGCNVIIFGVDMS